MSQNVIIIGGNRGIGLELVKQYSDKGYNVFATCRIASAELQLQPCNIIENIDVTDDKSVATLPQAVDVDVIDILIHNSGILRSDAYPAISIDNMKTHFDVNALGPLRTVQVLAQKLVNGSKVGIVSSRVGSIEDNSSSNNYAYRVSKTAVNMIGKCLSLDLKEKGIAVALLHPGYVRTEMTANRGIIDTDEAASGMIARMDELSLSTSGMFFHANGEILPW
jgi:NAD(P)-dependent dehydrogenase (short-subunit alcohol dehydrogenase family)